jgi:RNA polymerase sigma-70 factor (subfamily 1)
VSQPSDWSLERYRPLLRLQVRQLQRDPRLRPLWDDSDLVQDAYCRAIEKRDQFHGTSEGELVRWLQRILANTVTDHLRAARAQKRDVGLVQSLEQAVNESSVRLDECLAAEHSSPSEQAERGELLVRLAAALDQLPEPQRDVIIHHHLHGAPVAEIALRVGKADEAVAMLLYRGNAAGPATIRFSYVWATSLQGAAKAKDGQRRKQVTAQFHVSNGNWRVGTDILGFGGNGATRVLIEDAELQKLLADTSVPPLDQRSDFWLGEGRRQARARIEEMRNGKAVGQVGEPPWSNVAWQERVALTVLVREAEEVLKRPPRVSAVPLPKVIEKPGEVRQFTGHTDGVITVAVSPDGRRALSGSWMGGTDRIVRLWDIETAMEVLQLRGHVGAITCVAFAPDGARALSGGLDRTVRLWDLTTGKQQRFFARHGAGVYAVLFSRDGKLAVSAAHEAPIRVWDLERGAQINALEGHNGPVRGLALSSDGKLLASAGHDGRVRLWEFPAGKAVHTLAVSKNQVNTVAFSPDGSRLVAGGEDRLLRLFDVKTGKELRRFVGHSNVIHAVAFTTDGNRVLSGSYDRTLRLWNADTGAELRRYEGHRDLVLGVACTPDGRYALSASYDRTVRAWQLPASESGR